MSRDNAVAIKGLSRDFGEVRAVDALTVNVHPGELFGLVGPDGAGKTTTLRMLAGVLPPTSGDAVICGLSVRDQAEAVKQFMAYMPQRFGLYEDLTVAENLTFYADLYRVPKDRRPDRLERLYHFSQLEPFTGRLAGALSGGMKQKLSLSCALIHQPRVLFLDEPTFGVDPISRRDLWLIVLEMVAEGVTVITSTSYMEEAERFDRVALLDEGSVIALDTPSALEAELTGRLFHIVASQPRSLRDRLRPLPGVVSAMLFGDKLHVLLESTDRAVLTRAGIGPSQIHTIDPGLEDVFLARTDAA